MHKLPAPVVGMGVALFLAFAGLTAMAPAGPPPAPGTGAVKPAPGAKPRSKEVPLVDRLHSPVETRRPISDKLRSPRETLKTLYFAILLYDIFPQMIEDAIACLDLDGLETLPAPEDAARLALDLENILGHLAVPLSSVPDAPRGSRCVLHEEGPVQIALQAYADGSWKFDAATLRHVTALSQSLSREPARTVGRSALREGYTDPRSAMRQFISDAARNDFYAAARALDLSLLSNEERRRQGPGLAQQLAFVIQHRGFVFRQEVPERADGAPYTWHADGDGRIALERVHHPDGKDAWLFTKQTVRNIPRMYAAAQKASPDPRYVKLGLVIPLLKPGSSTAVQKCPEEVPPHLRSPRALLQGFFRTMEGADTSDNKLADALEYLELDNVPLADRAALGGKLALKLDAVLRKLSIDLRAISDDWNAPTLILGQGQGVAVEIAREHDGSWSFSEATVGRIPEMYEKLAGKTRTDAGRGWSLDSARDTVMTFQAAARRSDFTHAALCLNLSSIPVSAQDELGPVLALKLQYILDRIGPIYIQEISDNPEAPRYVLYRGELGRISLDRKGTDPNKGQWQVTGETVEQIETMFRAVRGLPCEEPLAVVRFWEAPGVWLRVRLPGWLLIPLGPLDLYQWLGATVVIAVSWAGARITLALLAAIAAWVLRRCGSSVSSGFVSSSLRPATVLAAVWTLFFLLQWLDLHVPVASPVFAAEKFCIAGLLGWMGLRLMDLSMAIYTNAELLRPHRSLSDMIVPVSMRLCKAVVVLVVLTYMIYQVGQIDLLGRFLTGLGVAGLAASLAAQDAMKSFFGTLLLIGERAFKIGDHICVGGKEGTVEQVGFRSTRLRSGDDALITIPNAIIAASSIDNMGRHTRPSFRTSLRLAPDSALQAVLDFRERLRAWLVEQPGVYKERVEVLVGVPAETGVEVTVILCLTSSKPADEVTFREALACEVTVLAGALALSLVPERATGFPDSPTTLNGRAPSDATRAA